MDNVSFRRYLREQGLDEDMPDAGAGLDELAPGPMEFGPTLADAPVEPVAPPDMPADPPPMTAPRQAPGYDPERLPSQGPNRVNGLDAAQRADESSRRFGDTSDALAAAFARRPVPQAHQPQAARDFANLEAFRQSEQTRSASQAAKDDADNPESEGNTTARELLKSTPMGAALAQRMGPAFDRLTTKNLPMLAQFAAASRTNERPRDALKDEKTQLEIDALRQGLGAKADKASGDKSTVEGFLAQYGIELSPEARAKIATATPEGATKLIQMAIADKRAKAAAAAAAERARTKAANAATAKGEKQAKADALINIPGWDASPDVRVKPEVAQKLRDTVGGQKSLETTVGGIESLFKQYGNQPLPGPAKSKMQALLRDLQLNLKGEAQFDLGVLTGPDLKLLEEVTGDPNRAGNTILDYFSGGENTLSKLQLVRQQSRMRFENKLNSSGYTRQSGSTPGKSSPPPGAVSKEEDDETGEVRYLDANGQVL